MAISWDFMMILWPKKSKKGAQQNSMDYNWLVVGIPTPLKHMGV